ncbi:hypothetical protein [Xylophilus sp. GOD-11R]|uniref:hypothetical protein n=1 Tax=Xylophilus sp. GOD-11R TaxID=3089814 RepID=UPI00298D490B|nr:hypothetical protein [Xylophilus sp. GOD-11R]WPB54994.1 hypothetical protein R9X41_12505 [Xylophilus sp. GOD-11R]
MQRDSHVFLPSGPATPHQRFCFALLTSCALVGCGGGNDSVAEGSSAANAMADSPDKVIPISLADHLGNYARDCFANPASVGNSTKIEIGLTQGVGRVLRMEETQTFYSGPGCTAAALVAKAGYRFEVTQLDETKRIVGTPENPVSGTAHVMQTQLKGVDLYRMPAASTKSSSAKRGITFEGDDLRFVEGPEEADGLGKVFSII